MGLTIGPWTKAPHPLILCVVCAIGEYVICVLDVSHATSSHLHSSMVSISVYVWNKMESHE